MIKALIVDDDQDLLEMVCLMLRANNMKVSSLSSGSLFFDTLVTDAPDIVVMDIFLGDNDGRHLCKELKSREEFSPIPVILYSAGNITPDSIVDARADDFIAKPFDMKTLVNRIRELAA